MKKRIICFITALSLSLMCSCSNKKNKGELPTSSSDTKYINLVYNKFDGGRLFSDNPKMYIDYNTMERTPLCSKPNCTHNTGECPGKVMGECPMVTDDGIYFFVYNDGVNELKNGEREHYMKSRLCRISLDSAEMEEIASFTDCVPHDYDGVLLYDNKIYFTGTDLNPTEDAYGYINVSNVGGNQFFCSIDLETGEYENYGCIYDIDQLSENGKNDNSASVKGIYNSKIYIEYRYVDSTNIKDENGIPIVTSLMFEFDPETHQIMPSSLPKPLNFLDNETYIYYDEKSEKTVVMEKNKKKEYDISLKDNLSFLNNKFFCNDKCYDMNDMSVYNMPDKYESFWAFDYYDGYYILVLGNETVKLTEEDLLALDKEE